MTHSNCVLAVLLLRIVFTAAAAEDAAFSDKSNVIHGKTRHQKTLIYDNEAIPFSLERPQTLTEIYDGSDDRPVEILLDLNFASEPLRWLPGAKYNNTSEFYWSFAHNDPDHQADNAFFKLPCSGKVQQRDRGSCADGKGAELISAPFQKWYPFDQAKIHHEGSIVWNKSISVNAAQRVLVRLKFSCKIADADEHPFPATLVRDPDDDFRLANCVFGVDTFSVSFNFKITNKSIWAVYTNVVGLYFNAKRRVGTRRSSTDIIDAGIEYDVLLNQATFYVNGQPVWIISQIGLLPPTDGGLTTIDIGPFNTVPAPRQIDLVAFFGTQKWLDQTDPNNSTNPVKLVKVFKLYSNNFYRPNDVFYDPDNKRSNVLWGQAVKMTLYKLVILRAEARTQQQQQRQLAAAVDNGKNDTLTGDDW